MSDRIWQFKGKLQENNKRVITEAEGTVSEITTGESPRLDIKSNDGKLIVDLKLPTAAADEGIGGVGKQFIVDGVSTNIVGQKYGEIFNDYDNNIASGIYSHVAGVKNQAQYPYQVVFGKYNYNKENNILEIGYGDNDYNRANIFEITKDGVATIATDIGNKRGISLESLQKNKLEASEFDYLVGESQARIHTYINTETYTINNTQQLIISIDFLTTDATTPMFFASIPFELSTNALVSFTYYLNNSLLEDATVEENYTAGKHFATLFNTLDIKENYAGTLNIKMKVSAGTAIVTEYKLRSALYVQGVGITAAWNGKINITQNFTDFSIDSNFDIKPFRDIPEVTQYIPIPEDSRGKPIDKFGAFSIGKRKMNFLGIADMPPIINEVIKCWIFRTSAYDKYIYNNNYIIIKDESFMFNTQYDDDYISYPLDINIGNGTYIDIDITKFTEITNINVIPFIKKFEIPENAEVIFSINNKANYEYNNYIDDTNTFKLKTNYNELDYKITNNILDADAGRISILDILPVVQYTKIKEINIATNTE